MSYLVSQWILASYINPSMLHPIQFSLCRVSHKKLLLLRRAIKNEVLTSVRDAKMERKMPNWIPFPKRTITSENGKMTHLLVGSSSIFRCRRTDSFREGKWLFFSKQNGAPSKTSRHFSISNYSQSESRMKTTYMKLRDPLKHLNDSRPIFLILKLTGLTDQGQNSTGFTSYELQGEAFQTRVGIPIAASPRWTSRRLGWRFEVRKSVNISFAKNFNTTTLQLYRK